jgi:hypothetical protein
MSTLTQFFGDAVASGASEFVTDPRKMDWVVWRLPYSKARRQTSYHAGQTQFWDYNLFYCNRDTTSTDIAYPLGTAMTLPTNMHSTKLTDPLLKWGNQIKLTDADLGSWVELANVSGKAGFISSIIGPGQYGYVGSDSFTDIKIILDGVEYIFEAQHAHWNNIETVEYQRLTMNFVGGAGTSNGERHDSFHGYWDMGNQRADYNPAMWYGHNNILYQIGADSFMRAPYGAGKSYKGLRFENSFQIFVKNHGGPTTQSTVNYSEYAGAYWTFDYQLPGW